MKVKELIELLKSVDPELRVIAEGCDCFRECIGIERLYMDMHDDYECILINTVNHRFDNL